MKEKDAIQAIKVQLARDAVQWEKQQDAPQWLDTAAWPQYMGRGVREKLYWSFIDQEPAEILQAAASRLGRLPNKKGFLYVPVL